MPLKIFGLITLRYIQRNWQSVLLVLTTLGLLIFLQLKFDYLRLNNSGLSEGFIGTYQTNDLPPEVTKLVSKSLVESDENGRMKGALVSGWETNHDATIFKFKLRNDINWSDGTPIRSTDIELNIPNVEVSYPDSFTLEFKLKEPYSPFPSLLTQPVLKKGTLIGTGPYKISRVEKSRVFITKITLSPIPKDLPPVVVRFYPNEKTALTGFKLGEVQSLLGVNSIDRTSSKVSLQQKTDYNKIVTIFYNMKDPVVGGTNRSLRQALSYSAPQISGVEEANNPLPPFSWAYKKEKDYLNNPDEAKAALQRAKNNSSQELLQKEIVLTTTPSLEEVGQNVVSSWKNLGLNAVLRVESGIPQNFQALLIVQGIPTDPDQYFLWHATQEKTNLTKYDSKRVDKDLEDGRKSVSEGERLESYLDFQRTLLEDSPATFLYFPKYNVVYLQKAEDKLSRVLPLQL